MKITVHRGFGLACWLAATTGWSTLASCVVHRADSTQPDGGCLSTEISDLVPSELADVLALARAAFDRGDNVQLRATWVGLQSEIVPTVVLGSPGHRLGMAKYAELNRDGLHYGNDDADLVLFHQLSKDDWKLLLAALNEDRWHRRFGNSKRRVARAVRHWTLCITKRTGGKLRSIEMLAESPDELCDVVRRSMSESPRGRQAVRFLSGS